VHQLDAQSRAYREMTRFDVMDDHQLAAIVAGARRHEPLDPGVPVAVQLHIPADFERLDWDAGRIDPRPGA
jgi:hypothetical protein